MVLWILIVISLILFWIIISPTFGGIGELVIKKFENIFKDDQGGNRNE